MTTHAVTRILDRDRTRPPASLQFIPLVAFASALALALAPAAAHAQRPPGEEMARQQLIERAQAAHQSGAHADALGLAQRAAQIRKTPTLLLFIAQEQEELGQYADAYAYAQQCAREAELDPEAKLRDKAIERCRSLASGLKGRISYVVVNAPNPPAGLSIRLSGQQLNQAAIGVPYVITPGKVSVEATAPGRVPYRLEIDVPEAKTVNVTVSLAPEATPTPCPANQRPDGAGRCVNDSCRPGMLPAAEGASCCWPGQAWDEAARNCVGAPRCPEGTEPSGNTCIARRAAASAPPASAAESAPFHERAKLKPQAIAVAAAGVAALATAGIVWLVSNGRFNDLKSACNDLDGCTPAYREDKVNGILRLDKWAAGFAIGGAAAVGAAAVLQWAWPREPEARQARLVIDPMNQALFVRGRF